MNNCKNRFRANCMAFNHPRLRKRPHARTYTLPGSQRRSALATNYFRIREMEINSNK